MGLGQWAWGFPLVGLLWALYVWRPRIGAGAAMMILTGVIIWQAKNKAGLFGLA